MNDVYCKSRFNCVRLKTREVNIGNVRIGAGNPIAVQSMTNTKTQDVEASFLQCVQLAEAGCQIIRLTAQNLEAAHALGEISKKFKAAGFSVPLVADIHFLPQTAMEAVKYVEKIRINPGNFTDRKLGDKTNYTDAEYDAEIDKIRDKLTPLVLRCKELGRALRIGTNHGSLSDRIIRRYGDTPLGMVEAAFEFARICRDLNFHNLVFSFKASNTRIMTQTYRLAAQRMFEEGLNYPLHLGVTEAGFGIDARIKSSMGIGGLLFDGIGDTIRVSLTEEPVKEIPVAKMLVSLADKIRSKTVVQKESENIDFYSYTRRPTRTMVCQNVKIGENAVPPVASIGKSGRSEFSFVNGVCRLGDQSTICFGKFQDTTKLSEMLLKNTFTAAEIDTEKLRNFRDILKSKNLLLVPPSPSVGRHAIGEARLFATRLRELDCDAPIWLKFDKNKAINPSGGEMSLLSEASIYIGSLLVDGIGDMVSVEISRDPDKDAAYALAILQGARSRRSKTEYIACPSCGRTLYDIQNAVARIQKATSHLKDVTIAVMGCIVNGPGEMADADFGYVGGAPGKINLYKNKRCVEVNIPQEESIEHLIALIKSEGKWIEP